MSGYFITLEGGEGSGKTTQRDLLIAAFHKAGLPLLTTREPGGSAGAEKIRNLLVTGDADAWSAEAETLLFYAARMDHVQRVIQPALAAGTHVMCDRFADSTLVYQGAGKGLSEAYIENLHNLTLGNFAPHLTLVLDIEPTLGLKRAGARRGDETRFESMDLDFHHRIRAGFLELSMRAPQRVCVLAADQDKDALHAEILTTIRTRLGLAL
jgi:dTMP kinase